MNRLIARRRKGGFTLIELLVVVLILAILMAVALPLYLSAVNDSEVKTCRSNMQTIANAEQAYRVKWRGAYTSNMTLLLPDLQFTPTCPANGTYSITVGTPANAFTVNCNGTSGGTAHGSFVPGQGS